MQLTAEFPVHLFNADLVACYVLREHSFGDMRHYHPVFFELTLVRRGGTEGWVGDKLDRLTPGALVLPSPDLPMPTATRPSGAAVDMPEHPLPSARCSAAPHSGPLCFHTFQYVEAASPIT